MSHLTSCVIEAEGLALERVEFEGRLGSRDVAITWSVERGLETDPATLADLQVVASFHDLDLTTKRGVVCAVLVLCPPEDD